MTETIVGVSTTEGPFKIKLYTDKAPITTKNFIDLVNKGFYNGQRFHRVIPNFMIQGGDPKSKDADQKNAWGTGGPGYEIKDEFHEDLKHNKKGILSMANSGPNSGGSQFFITVAPTPHLDGKHAVFGEIVEGYEVVQKISKVPTEGPDRPVNDVVVEMMRLEN